MTVALKFTRIVLALWPALALLAGSGARAADIKVFSDQPLEPALVKIADAFRRDSGHTVTFVFATSPAIRTRLMGGEAADAVVIQMDFVEQFIKSGKVAPGDHPVIARVGVGLAVRADAPEGDIASEEALKQTLLRADSLVFNTLASGTHFASVLDRLGIADAVSAKVTRLPPAEVFARVVQGKGNDIAVGTVTQILGTKGLKLLGRLPPGLQAYLVYGGVTWVDAKAPDAAAAFVRALASPDAKAAFAAAGAN
jgi:molybdate transport system substrate-binding protein